MKPIVRKRNESWNILVCTDCCYILDEFHSECNYDEKCCPKCGVELEKSDYQIKQDKEYIEQLEQIIDEKSQVIKELKSIEAPESIKNLSREQLEELCLSAMSSENKATHRANDLEDIIEEATEYINQSIVNVLGIHKEYDGNILNQGMKIKDTIWGVRLLEILSKYKRGDELWIKKHLI